MYCRSFKFSIITLYSLLSIGTVSVAYSKDVTIISHKVICEEPNRYIGWPTVVYTKKGELLAVFSGDRDEHVCPWGKTQIVRSKDLGNTWTKPITINNTPLDDRDAGIIETQKGTLLVSWFTSLYFETHNNPLWKRHSEKIDNKTRQKWLGNWVRRSLDGGTTWEEPIRTHFSAPHGPIQLQDGRLLYVGWNAPDKIGVEESRDDGLSWQVIGAIPISSTEQAKYFTEPHVVEVEKGKLIALMRYEEPNEEFLHQSESSNGGKTWSVAHSTGIWGFPPHVIKLKNGYLLASFGRRKPPYGEHACISKDGGKSWDVENEIIINSAPNNDLGYPASVQLDDNSIFTVYYQKNAQSKKTILMGTHWRFDN
ncbi:MAG: sialidase family protein [Phycisphaerales bacterium]